MRPEEFPNTGGTAVVDPPESSGDLSWPPIDESFWSESTPDAVRTSYASGERVAGWKAWKRHLLRRRDPQALGQLWSGNSSMLAWGDAAPADAIRLAWLLQLLDRRRSKRTAARETVAVSAQQWMDEHRVDDDSLAADRMPQPSPRNGELHFSNGKAAAHAAHLTTSRALESLAWLHLLVTRTELFSGDLWWRVWQELYEIARRPAIALDDDPLGHQLAAGELPLTLAYLFPELRLCDGLHVPAAASLSRGMAELLDGEGLPQCRHLPSFMAILACWTRCRLLGEHLDGRCWNAEAEEQFPLALREAVRLSRPDGALALVGGSTAPLGAGAAGGPTAIGTRATRGGTHRPAWLVDVAAELVADKSVRRLIRSTLASRRKKAAVRVKPQQLSESAVHSEWAEIAVLRPDWSPRTERFTVAYGGKAVRVELAVGDDLLFTGRWDLEIRADGAFAEPVSDWREVCWSSDEDCDYLELEMELTGSLCVQRQILLARQDQFLFLADAILGERPQELSYRGRLPLASRVTANTAPDTRELLLEGRKARALVLPLALPEWRSDRRGGTLGIEEGMLELRQAWHGRSLFAPLWIDLSRRRAEKPFTWRQLTVAEQRQIQPADVAAGYRVQFGRRQWLVYRSLTDPGNRTVLGQNLSTDFFLGRFKRDGETETILEIE